LPPGQYIYMIEVVVGEPFEAALTRRHWSAIVLSALGRVRTPWVQREWRDQRRKREGERLGALWETLDIHTDAQGGTRVWWHPQRAGD
jgi:hypothetical protein